MKKLLLALLLLATPAQAAEKESAYERVIRTGTLRCGYILYSPAIMKDPATGALSGVFYDFVNELGKKLSLKVEWAEETGWGAFITDLESGRYDMMCSMAWKNAARGRSASPTHPLYYSPVRAWVRKADERFDADMMKANDPAYKLSTIDGAAVDILARSYFPKAERLALPEMTSFSNVPLNVVNNKADMTFIENYIAFDFMKNNPDTLKPVGAPLGVFENVMWVGKGQQDLQETVNIAIDEMLGTPLLDELFKKYDIPADAYMRRAKPYQEQ